MIMWIFGILMLKKISDWFRLISDFIYYKKKRGWEKGKKLCSILGIGKFCSCLVDKNKKI